MTAETQTAAPAKNTELIGKVTSAKMEKTIVVEVQRLVHEACLGQRKLAAARADAQEVRGHDAALAEVDARR